MQKFGFPQALLSTDIYDQKYEHSILDTNVKSFSGQEARLARSRGLEHFIVLSLSIVDYDFGPSQLDHRH